MRNAAPRRRPRSGRSFLEAIAMDPARLKRLLVGIVLIIVVVVLLIRGRSRQH